MKGSTISIAQGKRDFSAVIQQSVENNEDVIITKRGKPVAVIVPYEEYKRTRRADGLRKIMEVRKAFADAPVGAAEAYEESRRELEAKS